MFLTPNSTFFLRVLSELQNQLMAVETEITNKSKEIQNLHSNLKDMILCKEQEQKKVMQLEQKVRQLLEASQHNMQPDNQLQEQVQVALPEDQAEISTSDACLLQ